MRLPLPNLDVTGGLASFVVIALSMIVVTVVVLGLVRPRDGRTPLVTQLLLALTVVGGGSLLLLALLFVFLDPNGTTAWTWVLLAFNFMMTVPVGLWFVGQILYRDRRSRSRSWSWPLGLGFAVTGSEVLMGLLFVVGGASGGIGADRALADGLSSIWFFWSMAAVMAPLVLWAPLSSVGRTGGWALVAAASIGPWVRSFPSVGGSAMAALMAVAFLLVLRSLLRGRVSVEDSGLLLGLATAFLGMAAAGLAVALSSGGTAAVLAFGVTMALVMVGEVSYLLRQTFAVPGASLPTRGDASSPVGPAVPSSPHAPPGLRADPGSDSYGVHINRPEVVRRQDAP